MKVYLSEQEFSRKPNTYEIGKISKELLNCSVELDLNELAYELTTKGKVVVLSQLVGNSLSKDAELLSQELVMLDFDNKKEPYYTIDDLEQDEFMQENACFYYKTFSDNDSNTDKFRVAFHLDTIVTERLTIENIYRELFKRYPQSDTSIGQTSRLFFGSQDGYTEISFNNRLSTLNYELQISNKGEIIDTNLPNYLLMKYGKVELLKEKLKDNYSKVFPDYTSASNYFTTMDLKEFLELPDENPFLDILHDEENPSASVFLLESTGCYFYKCFSDGHLFTGDICRLICHLCKLPSISESIDYLIDITNSKIDFSSKLGKQKLNSNLFRKKLITGNLEVESPELYSYLKRYSQEINATLDIMFDYTYTNKETGEIEYLNYFSLDTLTNMVSNAINKRVTRDKMWNVLNLIVVTEMINKIPLDKIPKDLYDDIIIKQKNQSDQIRVSGFYNPSSFDEGEMLNTYKIAKVMKENNVTVSGISYELIYRLFGEDKAKRDFPQAYDPLKEKNLITMSKQNGNLTKKSVEFEKMVVKILLKEIHSKGFMYEKELLEKISKRTKTPYNTIRVRFSKMRMDIFNKYDLKMSSLNKKLAIDLELPVKSIEYRKNIIYINN